MDDKKQVKTAIELLKRILIWSMQDKNQNYRMNMNSGTLFPEIREFVNTFDSDEHVKDELHILFYKLKNCDKNNEELFYESIRESMILLKIDVPTLASMFDMSQSSVIHWIKGRCAPESEMRFQIYTNLITKCLAAMKGST